MEEDLEISRFRMHCGFDCFNGLRNPDLGFDDVEELELGSETRWEFGALYVLFAFYI